MELYKTYFVKKKSGGVRRIDEPCEELKQEQLELLKELEFDTKHVYISPFAHGGIPSRNVATNAIGHVRKKFVGSIDVKDFFPSITKRKFNNIVTNIDSDLKKRILDICFYNNSLPQGAPTSPYLANMYMYKFDWSSAMIMAHKGYDYSRYFDDITISTNVQSRKHVWVMLGLLEKLLIEKYDLESNPNKKRVIGRGNHQDVCGVIVNEKLNISRRYRMNLRAEVHQKGLELKTTQGKLAFVNMVRNNKIPLVGSMKFILSMYRVKLLSSVLTNDKIFLYKEKVQKLENYLNTKVDKL